MSKQAILLVVKSNGERIGSLLPEDFRRAEGVPVSMSLAEAVETWNGWKDALGDPERVSIELAEGEAR